MEATARVRSSHTPGAARCEIQVDATPPIATWPAPQGGVRDCLGDAVANRAYYAAYHAVAHLAQARGIEFTSDKAYYQHDRFADDAYRSGILDVEGARDLRELYAMRIKADYLDDPVEFDEADLAAELAQKLVTKLLP